MATDGKFEMSADDTVKVAGYSENEANIQEACQVIFGHSLTPEDFVALIAAPDGAELLVETDQDGESIGLKLRYTWSNGTHDYSIYLEDELRIVYIEHVRVKDEAPRYIATRLFAQQVNSFRKFGIDQVRLFAAGYPNDLSGYRGYGFWPRLGFVMSLGSVGARLIEAGFDYADNTLDLFIQPGGDDWWYNNGSEGDAVFYLDENFLCIQALQIYLNEQGVDINVGQSEETDRDSG